MSKNASVGYGTGANWRNKSNFGITPLYHTRITNPNNPNLNPNPDPNPNHNLYPNYGPNPHPNPYPKTVGCVGYSGVVPEFQSNFAGTDLEYYRLARFKATVLRLWYYLDLPCLVHFKPGYTCRTTVMFGTLKDGSLEINPLALNNCLSYRNVFQNGVNALSKMVWKSRFFVKKLKISCSLDLAILFKLNQRVVHILTE